MITADTKDWTWVIERRCPECGFDAASCPPGEVAGLVRENVAEWRRLLAEGVLRPGRPDESTWLSLEYACHVRDVYRRYDARVMLMLAEDDPLYPNWDQDASAVDDCYDEQVPADVVSQLGAAGDMLAARLDELAAEAWMRTGRRSDGAAFTVESIARYMIHDPIHHIWDVTHHLR